MGSSHRALQTFVLKRFHFSCALLEKGSGPNSRKRPKGQPFEASNSCRFSGCIEQFVR